MNVPIFREVDMRIEDILRDKGRHVVTITEDRTVLDAARALVEHNIGGVVVMAGDRLAGILTERDILRQAARAAGEMDSTRVGAAMTKKVIVARAGDDHTDLMNVMTENRIRHLPVMEEDRLIGIISIGDLVNACRHAAEAENSQLRQYIQGAG